MTTWDPAKRKVNIRKHRVDLAMAERFEMEAAIVEEDTSETYGEQRFPCDRSDRVQALRLRVHS